MRFIAAVILIAAAAHAAEFDAASIRKAAPEARAGKGMPNDGIKTSPLSLTIRNATLKTCIRWAWNISEFQVNGPDWIGNDRYDIVAKAGTPVPEDDLRLMLQTLLIDRFALEFHRTPKVLSTWVLSIAKTGPKFKESETEGDSDFQPEPKTMSITVKRAPVSQLIFLVSQVLQAPVIDETGLKGRYDLTVNIMKYLPQPGDGPPDLIGMITRAVQEELGLHLEQKKIPLDLLIVDHAVKSPGEN